MKLINALDISKFDIIPVLLDLYESHIEQAAEKELTLSKEIPEAEIILNGDRTRIANSIARLLSNSIKFTNKGGRVTIIVQDFLKEVEIIEEVGVVVPQATYLMRELRKRGIDVRDDIMIMQQAISEILRVLIGDDKL